MATAVSMDVLQKGVVSILQASGTAYGSGSTGDAPDGSNRQFPSATEIDDRILSVDGEICTAICNTIGSPYQSQFAITSAALASGDPVTKNVGITLKVLTFDGIAAETAAAAAVNTTANTITFTGTNFVTGTKVQFTTSGGLPSGLSTLTDYWLIRVDANTVQVASTYFNAMYGTAIDLTTQGTGNHTATPQYITGRQAESKEEILQVNSNPDVFGSLPGYVLNFWFIEGTAVYTTSPTCKVVYTDYTLTSSPQAPESYTTAIIAGAVYKLMKDGSDLNMAAYYGKIYDEMLASIKAGAKATPEITAYTR